MGLIGRFFNVLGAKLSRLIGLAEKPDEQLDWSYERMQDQLIQVKRGVADLVTAKKRIEIKADDLRAQVLKLENQSRQAMTAGREDLAQQAVEKKVIIQTQLTALDSQVSGLAEQQQHLVENQKQLETKIDNFRTQKEVLKARYSAGQAQVKIGEAATGIGNTFEATGRSIQRVSEQVEEMEARGKALDELVESGSFEDFTSTDSRLDRELREISSSSAVEDEMAKLREEVGAGAPAKELGE